MRYTNPVGILSNGNIVTPVEVFDFMGTTGVRPVTTCPHCGYELILHRTEPPHFEHKANEAVSCDHMRARGKI